MDDHIIVKGGRNYTLKYELIDDNLHPLDIWIDKHNKYSNREAVDMLSLEYSLNLQDHVGNFDVLSEVKIKRLLKENIYSKVPGGLRAFLYFIYRYIFRFGWLDGTMGFYFHFFQCFWYRTLVDAKIKEVKNYAISHNKDIKFSIKKILGIDLN
jgi:hypothetical protein